MARTILVVDDSPAICNIIKVYLMGRGYEVLDADGGERALQMVKLLQIDLVIADYKMPGMDGIAFVQKLRSSQEPRHRSMPVIMLTGERSPEMRARGVAAGISDFIFKPVKSEDLVLAVDRLLQPANP